MAVEQREIRRASFDEVAALYDEARPGYPDAVYDDLVALAGLGAGARVLEIGSGTGHATLPLAARGFRIDCVELGEQMAAVARARLAAFPDVAIAVSDFDGWKFDGSTGEGWYELAFSASAYHWLNPATRVQRIAELLVPGGHVATIRNYHVQGEASAEFNAAADRIYEEVFPGVARKGLPQAEEIAAEDAREWEASGLFHHAQTRVYGWQSRLSAGEYVRMLNTHSDHRLMPKDGRGRLFARLAGMIDSEFGGSAAKEYITLLQIAEKRG